MSSQRNHKTYMGGKNGQQNVDTPLGQACHFRGITAHALSIGTGINARTLSDYFSNRIPIRTHHLPLISQFLGVEPSSLMKEPEGGYDGEVMRVMNGNTGTTGKMRDRDVREEMVKPPGVYRVGGRKHDSSDSAQVGP